MTHKINLKSIECDCGLLCTSPKTHNDITHEFENFHTLRHIKRPEVIDGEDLRPMNDSEQKIHLDQVQKVAKQKHKELSKKYPDNKFIIEKMDTDIHVIHVIKCELVESKTHETDTTTKLICPKCDKILYEVQ